MRMIGIAVLHFSSQAFYICFIQFTNFNFVEFNLSFIVLDNVFNFMFEFIVVLLDKLKAIFLIAFEIFVNLKNSSNLIFFCCNYCSEDLKVVIIKSSEVCFSLLICLSFFSKLVIIETSQVFDSLSISIIIIFKLVSQVSIFINQSGNFSFTFFTCSLDSIVSFFNLMLFLFNFIVQSFDFSFMQIFQFIFILSMLSNQVILDIFILCLDKIYFMRFLFL